MWAFQLVQAVNRMKRTAVPGLPRTMLKGSTGLKTLARVSQTRSCVYSFKRAHHDIPLRIHNEMMATKKAPLQSPKPKPSKKRKAVCNNQRSIRFFFAPRGGTGLTVVPEKAQLTCAADQRSRLRSNAISSPPGASPSILWQIVHPRLGWPVIAGARAVLPSNGFTCYSS